MRTLLGDPIVRKLPKLEMATSWMWKTPTGESKSALMTIVPVEKVDLEEERVRIDMANWLERRPLRTGSPRASNAHSYTG